MKLMRPTLLLSAAVLLPVLAWAQVNAAASAAGSATTRLQPPTVSNPNLPAPPTMQTGAAGNNVTAPGSTTGVDGSSSTSVRSAPGAATTPPSTNSNAAVNVVTPPAQTGAAASVTTSPGPIPVVAGGETSVTIDSASAINQIQTATYANRDSLSASVGMRIDTSSRSLALLRERVNATANGASLQFERALNDVRNREQALRTTLQSATRATGESAWSTAQATLQRDYAAYVEAVANAEAAAQGSLRATP